MILLVLVSVVSLCCHLVTADVGRNSTQGEDDAWFLEKVVEHEAAIFALSKIHVFRLGPNEDLLLSLFRYARVTGIEAAMIVTCVGRFVFVIYLFLFIYFWCSTHFFSSFLLFFSLFLFY